MLFFEAAWATRPAEGIIDKSGGEATARAIPGARLLVIPGLGHDLPDGAWTTIIDAIVETARRAPS